MKKQSLKGVVTLLFLTVLAGALSAATIYEDSFDNGTTALTGWQRSSTSYVQRYTGSIKVGTAALRVRKNGSATTSINIKAFKSIKLNFKLAAYSLEGSEYVKCEYKVDNGSWKIAAKLANGADDKNFRNYSVSIPNGSDLQVRFSIVASSTYDYGYIDDVKIVGDKSTTTSTPPATSGSVLTIYEDRFDGGTSGVPGWKRSNKSYVQRYTGSIKQGSAALRLRKDYAAVTYINVAPFKNMKLNFKLAAYSLESGEYVTCEYKLDNGSWITAAKLGDGSDNKVFHSYSVSIPNGNILQVRFRMSANSTYDYGYVDDLKITGDRK